MLGWTVKSEMTSVAIAFPGLNLILLMQA
jgi:hypothetical protein